MHTARSFGIVAQHRVPERLPLHPGKPGGLSAGEAVEGVGDRQQPHGGAAIRLVPRQAAQLGGGQILADGECGHGEPPAPILPCRRLVTPAPSRIFGEPV